MDEDHIASDDLTPPTPDASLSTYCCDVQATLTGIRLRRIEEYQVQALQVPDVLEANLKAISGGLMQMAHFTEQAILAAIDGAPATLERVAPLLPALHTHMRLTKQTHHFAQVESRVAQLRKRQVDVVAKSRVVSGAASASSEETEI